MSFENKVVLVTGSSRGIGKATALELAERGADVAIDYVSSEDKAKKVVDKIKDMGRNSVAVQADVSSPEKVKRMMEEVNTKLGGLDVLVNNAGVLMPSPLQNFDKKKAMKTLEINLIGNLLCSKEAVPYLKKSNDPVIVNVASMMGELPSVGIPVYGASKAGVINVTKTLAKSLAPKIRVNAVAPGVTKTDMTAKSTAGYDQEQVEPIIEKTPLNRLDEPENVAEVIAFLASDKACFITGNVIFCDGGYFLK